jgi:hypothetical protein
MSNNLIPFIDILTQRQKDYLLKVFVEAKLDIHAGSMWFLNRDVALKALNDHLVAKKKEQSTRVSGMNYYDPNKNKGLILYIVTLLEVIEGADA